MTVWFISDGTELIMQNRKTAEIAMTSELAARKVNPIDMCEYVAEMSLELRNMCKQSGQPYLAYLLEIVFAEATDIGTKARIKAQSQASNQSGDPLA